jgi:hypothetical protein
MSTSTTKEQKKTSEVPPVGISTNSYEGTKDDPTETRLDQLDVASKNDDDDDTFYNADDGSIDDDQSIIDDRSINNINNNNNEKKQQKDKEDNEITLDTLRDNIVSHNTNKAYIGDLTLLLEWIFNNEVSWLTEYGVDCLKEVFTKRGEETVRKHRSRIIVSVKKLLRDAHTHHVVVLPLVTAPRFMEFIFSLKNKKNHNRFLSKSSYGNHRSSLFHLFRMHNRRGYSEELKSELSSLFKSFFRRITKQRTVATNSNNDNDNNNSNNNKNFSVKEGKEPLSVALYKSLAGWLLDFGTQDGVFAHCYLVLTWNLACRCGNTARITFRDVSWTESFDSFSVLFSHSKTDQLGEQAKHARHIFSNPLSPIVCPVLSLAIYLQSCFNTQQTAGGLLFPGNGQDARFSIILARLLLSKKREVELMGYNVDDLGTHSIRKGAVSYLASLPGGPPAASTCIRAGWTMGKVRDIYMRYVTSGDQFVGRCLSLLSVLRTDFAISPPHFLSDEYSWIDDCRLIQFPMVGLIAGFEKVTRMCLASILFHSDWLRTTLMPNHIVLMSSHLHRSAEVQSKKGLVVVSYPWNDDKHTFSGIPPHVSILQQLQSIKESQGRLIGEFVEEVSNVMSRFNIDGGQLTEEKMRKILNEFQQNFQQQFKPNNVINDDDNNINRESEIDFIESGRMYSVHYWGGGIHRLPQDWRFPRVGVFDMWRQWWIGDSERKIPPLRLLHARDFLFLKAVPLDNKEKNGRTGHFKGNRRDSTKTWNDLQFLMDYIHQKVVERNAVEREVTPSSVDRMFKAVCGIFTSKERDSQMRWLTVLLLLRRRLKSSSG